MASIADSMGIQQQAKETLFVEVWKHLQACRGFSAYLTMLAAPTGNATAVRAAWNRWREHGGSKKKGLQAMLQERSDLFIIGTNERGSITITLTETAKQTVPSYHTLMATSGEGFLDFSSPAAAGFGASGSSSSSSVMQPGTALGTPAEQASEAALAIEKLLAEREAAARGADPSAQPEANEGEEDDSPEAKRRRLCQPTAKALPSPGGPRETKMIDLASLYGPEAVQAPDDSGFLDFHAPTPHSLATPGNKTNNLFSDLVWTPAVSYCQQRDRRKDFDLIVAIYRLMETKQGQVIGLSQIGGDYAIAQMKKDPLYKQYKMVDLIRLFKDWFEVVPDPAGTGFAVQFLPSAQAKLPEVVKRPSTSSSQGQLGVESSFGTLPKPIEQPSTMVDRIQALRIAVIHALAKRGNKLQLQDLGQDAMVQKAKQSLSQAKKLMDMVKLFPMNFKVTTGAQGAQAVTHVELESPDVSDKDPIDKYLLKTYQAQQSYGGGGSRNYGYNNYNRDKGRGRSYQPAPVPPRNVPSSEQIFMPGSSYGNNVSMASAFASAEAQAQAQYLAQIASGSIGASGIPQVGFSPQL